MHKRYRKKILQAVLDLADLDAGSLSTTEMESQRDHLMQLAERVHQDGLLCSLQFVTEGLRKVLGSRFPGQKQGLSLAGNYAFIPGLASLRQELAPLISALKGSSSLRKSDVDLQIHVTHARTEGRLRVGDRMLSPLGTALFIGALEALAFGYSTVRCKVCGAWTVRAKGERKLYCSKRCALKMADRRRNRKPERMTDTVKARIARQLRIPKERIYVYKARDRRWRFSVKREGTGPRE